VHVALSVTVVCAHRNLEGIEVTLVNDCASFTAVENFDTDIQSCLGDPKKALSYQTGWFCSSACVMCIVRFTTKSSYCFYSTAQKHCRALSDGTAGTARLQMSAITDRPSPIFYKASSLGRALIIATVSYGRHRQPFHYASAF